MFAAPVPLDRGRETFLVRPLTLRRLGTLEHALLLERGDPLAPVEELARSLGPLAGRMTERLKELVAERADAIRATRQARCVERADLQTWLRSPAGLASSAWLCLYRRGRPAFRGRPHAAQWLARAGEEFAERFRLARDMASGIDLLSVLDWPEGDGQGPRFVPWKKTARGLAELYGFDPTQAGNLTLWNLAVYTAAEEQLAGGIQSVDVAAAREMFPAAFGPQARRQMAHAWAGAGDPNG